MNNKAPGQLLFPAPPPPATRDTPADPAEPSTLGLTEPNPAGHTYRHGTRTATTDTTGANHISRTWFRRQIWQSALSQAGLPFHVRVHDLRHAHASWLLSGGADLQAVKDRMGHARLTTTEQYLHTLPHADAATITALDNIRNRNQ